MPLDLTHPIWLWLLPPGVAWIVWLARTSYVQTGFWPAVTVTTLRLAIVLLLVLALAGARWRQSHDGMNIVFALDRSDSVPLAQQEFAREWIRKAAQEKTTDDRAGLVVFGADASIESSASTAPNFAKIEAIVRTGRSDIASALRLASAALPESGQRRIVLLSDGNENLGDALNAAASASALQADIHVVPLGGEKKIDVSIQRLQLPAVVKKGQSFEAKVFIQSDHRTTATLQLFRNEQFLGEQRVQLEAGKNLFSFPQSLPDSGFYTYDARLDSLNDEVPQNNRAFAFTQVRSVPRLLILSSDPSADASLVQALKSPEIEVVLADIQNFPSSLAELQSYDSMVFCNVSAGDLAREQQELLQSAVRDFGTGFVCIGGDQTYAAGGYRGTPLAEILPVDVEISSKKVLPPGALMLVIDHSGSMTGDKLEMAKQGAAAAVQALAPSDYVGVIAFDDAPQVVVPIQRAGEREDIIQRIFSIGGGGGTAMYPPMEQAHTMLRNNPGSFKHCIILTDGVSTPGDFATITRAMVGDRITVSTVAIGSDADTALLEKVAGLGQGRFYPVLDLRQLPQIFLKETAIILKSAISEETFTPRLILSSEPIRGIGAYPPLRGYVVTETKARAETPLLTDQGDPLLAHWQFGLGRVAAFTSDARAKWAQEWLDWNQYQQFWKQIVQWSQRRLENGDLTVAVATEHGEARVSVEALDGNNNFRNFLDLQALVVTPGREKKNIALKQTGPGHYEATFPMHEPGAYLLNVMQLEKGSVRAAQAVGASLNYSPELETTGPNTSFLRRIAETGNGKVIDPSRIGSNPYFDDRRKTWQPYDLWDKLLAAAIVLFVIDIGIRRVRIDRDQMERAWNVALGWVRFGSKPKPSTDSEGTTFSMLLAKRTETQRPAPAPKPAFIPTSQSSFPDNHRLNSSQSTTEPPASQNSQSPRPIDSPGSTSRLLDAKRRAKRRP